MTTADEVSEDGNDFLTTRMWGETEGMRCMASLCFNCWLVEVVCLFVCFISFIEIVWLKVFFLLYCVVILLSIHYLFLNSVFCSLHGRTTWIGFFRLLVENVWLKVFFLLYCVFILLSIHYLFLNSVFCSLHGRTTWIGLKHS